MRAVWDGLLTTLNKGLTPVEFVCPHCKVPHTDTDKYASFAHKRHLCGNCRKWFDTDEKVVCNVLAGWTPTLKGD